MLSPLDTSERREILFARLEDARARTDALFTLLNPEALYDRAIPERHRLVFYLGHLEAFDWNLLAHTAVNRVEAHTDVDNIAEQRALEGAGFMREGLIRGAQWRDGANRDGYLYAVVRDDIATNGVAK